MKFSEDTLTSWTRPPSDTEENKLSNAEKLVREAINNDEKLSAKSIYIFGQGSYANDTNVRLNSDIDINVRYSNGFYFDLPKDKKREDFGSRKFTKRERPARLSNLLLSRQKRNGACAALSLLRYRRSSASDGDIGQTQGI